MLITERKPKKRAKFRISFVVLFFLASIIICFLAYMRNDNDFAFPGGDVLSEKTTEDTAAGESDTDEDAETPSKEGNGGIVGESEKKDLSYFNSAMFIGSSELSSLSGFAWVKPERVLSDNMISSENIGSLVLKWDGKNQTPTEAALAVKPSALYILLRPEAEFDAKGLKSFTDEVLKASENTEIYIISAFPPTEESSYSAADAETFNSSLLDFAEENDIKYLDINLSLIDNAGRLKQDYISGNGISGVGAEFFANYILSHT